MDVHDTKLMTQVQYLAPLMAYFNPHLGDDSKVSTLDDGKLIFVWAFLNNNMYIHNWPLPIGTFQDQCKQTLINKYSNKYSNKSN